MRKEFLNECELWYGGRVSMAGGRVTRVFSVVDPDRRVGVALRPTVLWGD
jgi:hypothetical protein